MKLRGIDFGNVLGASGMQGFFGEGYWFHNLWKKFGLDFSGITFVSKTATLFKREGNMPLTENYVPKQWFPSCVKVKLWKGIALNSVGLSNPGIEALLNTGQWQKRKSPFMISIMSLADNSQKRLEELNRIVDIIGLQKQSFSAPFGLQVNLSCPNTGHNSRELIGESERILGIVGKLGVPVVPKYSIVSAPIQAVMQLSENPDCDAICVSNTIPFGWQGINWQKIWGRKTSPLLRLGGGGLSGKVLRPLVCNWIKQLRDAGFQKPINGGGGILCKKDVVYYHKAGASSVFLGSVAILRPWRLRSIVSFANNFQWR